jgi:hypothetical protein
VEGTSQRKYGFGLVHAFYMTMGGFALERPTKSEAKEDPSEPSKNTGNTADVVKFDTFVYIMKNFPNIIPDIPKESITDRSESSSLGTFLLIVQVGWFCTNCASRLFQRLEFSLLEVTTAAHALCSLLTYFIWFSKPVNLAQGTIMKGGKAQEVHALLSCSEAEYQQALNIARATRADSATPSNSENGRITLAANALRGLSTPQRPPPDPFRTDGMFLNPGTAVIRTKKNYDSITMAICPFFYGLIHLFAWNEHFPTPVEGLLWRVSSVVIVCSGLVMTSSGKFSSYLARFKGNYAALFLRLMLWLVITFLIPIAYVLASGFLVVESFRQLFFLEPSVYQLPSRSIYWPHLS